jgi:tRNA A37 threonylcarbamoyladenosine dehydratase
MDKRFFRTELLYGEENFRRIQKAKVLIIGLGGVGYTAAEALIRSGVSHLTLVDCDIIEESDFNRHILGLSENLGMLKVEAAYRRLRGINDDAEIRTKGVFFHRDSIPEIFDERYDFLIDAIDSLNPKVELIKFALSQGINFVSTMGAARRRSIELVRVCRISETKNCPLARHIRKRLHKSGIYEDFYVVSSSEVAETGVEKNEEGMFYERGRRRDILPSSMIVPAVFGLYAAKFTIEQIIRLNTENK